MKPEQLAAKLQAHPFSAVREELMQKVTLAALRRAIPRTPWKPGPLRRSEINRVEPGGLRGYIGTNITYAPFVHDGTRYMAGRPFLAEGISDARPDIAEILQQAGDDYFKAVLK